MRRYGVWRPSLAGEVASVVDTTLAIVATSSRSKVPTYDTTGAICAAAGASADVSGENARRSALTAGRARRATGVSSPISASSRRTCGETSRTLTSAGSSSGATRLRRFTAGAAVTVVRSSAADASCSSRSSAGASRTVAVSSRLRRAVAPSARRPDRTTARTASRSLPTVRRTAPPSRSSRSISGRSPSRIRVSSASSRDPLAKLPAAAFRSSSRPSSAAALLVSSETIRARVGASSIPSTRSSGWVGAIWSIGIVAPSRSGGRSRFPGDSATNVSPRSVFWRRIARTSEGSGA